MTPDELAQQLDDLALSASDAAEPIDLAEQIRRLTLTEPTPNQVEISNVNCHHLFLFDFPAVDLLNAEDDLYLPEPHLVDWRSNPHVMTFHLNMWDPLDLFSLLNRAIIDLDMGEIEGEHAKSFLRAVQELAHVDGSTTVSIATHTVNHTPEVRVRLSTTLDGTSNTKAIWFDLSVADWDAIMSLPIPWIEVMGDVVYRKTTRSFLAAESKLQQHSSRQHHKDMQLLRSRWGSGCPRSAKTLLINQLRRLNFGRVLPFDSLEEDGSIYLPCGHSISISLPLLKEYSEEECMAMECFFCRTPVIPPGDLEEARLSNDYYGVLSASTMEDAWARLHEWITDDNAKVFSKSALLLAVPAAVKSLRLPETIESERMCPIGFKETAFALDAVKEWLNEKQETMRISPFNLVNQLGDYVGEKFVEMGLPFPPIWVTFMKIALNRAVNLATLRRCSKLGSEHEGVHLHERNIFVRVEDTSAVMEDGEEEELGCPRLRDMADALDMDLDDAWGY